MKVILLLIMPLLIVVSAFSQKITAEEILDGWDIFGQAHVIPYIDGRDFNNETYAPAFTTMRLDFGVKKTYKKIDFLAKLQDSRIFGQTGLTNHTTGRIGLLEAYIRYNDILDLPFSIQVGSFQMDYGTGRFIGKSPWNFTQRSFDGGLLRYKSNNMFLDVFATNVSTPQVTQMLSPVASGYPIEAVPYEGYDIFGFWYHNTSFKNSTFDITFFFEDNSNRVTVDDLGDTYEVPELERFTVAGDYIGQFGDLKLTVDAGFQFGTKVSNVNVPNGTMVEKDIAAYLVSGKLDYKVGQAILTLGADMHSGTANDESEAWNTWDNVIARKHLFMGDLDYFIPARVGYGGIGVNDYYAGIRFTSDNKKWWTDLRAHHFMASAEHSSDETTYGQEVDWNTRYTIDKGIFVQYTAAAFIQGELMKEFWGVRNDIGFASYIRLMVTMK